MFAFLSLSEMRIALPAQGLLFGVRCITAGDEDALLPEEVEQFQNCTLAVLRQGGAARMVARSLLTRHGHNRFPLHRRIGRGPLWPKGIVGSLAHCDEYAAAAVAPASEFPAIGIDIEPADPIPDDVFTAISMPKERMEWSASTLHRVALFSAKEAAYKAAYLADGINMNFYDIIVDLNSGIATTPYGRAVLITVGVDRYIVTIGILKRE